MFNEDYVEIYECGNCNKGYVAKTKDNTPGFRFSRNFLCIYCILKSKKGKLIYEESGTDMLPTKYLEGIKVCKSNKEYKIWQKIWFSQDKTP